MFLLKTSLEFNIQIISPDDFLIPKLIASHKLLSFLEKYLNLLLNSFIILRVESSELPSTIIYSNFLYDCLRTLLMVFLIFFSTFFPAVIMVI